MSRYDKKCLEMSRNVQKKSKDILNMQKWILKSLQKSKEIWTFWLQFNPRGHYGQGVFPQQLTAKNYDKE
jgi:predicted transcriptional regulator